MNILERGVTSRPDRVNGGIEKTQSQDRSDAARRYEWLLLFLAIGFPAIGQVHRVAGVKGLIAYLVVLAVVCKLHLRVYERLPRWLKTENNAFAAGLFILALLFTAFLVVNPKITASSDRDEALDQAAHALLNREFPYSAYTFQGHPISPLPGSILMAMPFVVLFGSSAYQNFFWIGALLNLVRRASPNGAYGQAVIWMFLLGSPQILWEIVSGSDLLANSIFVTMFTALATGVLVQKGQESGGRRTLMCMMLGLALSSRANFLFGLPIALGAITRDRRFAEAAARIGIVLSTFTVITLPVYLYDPAHFTPLHGDNFLRALNPSGLRLDVVFLVLTAVVAPCLGWAVYRGRADVLLSHAAVQFMLIIPPVLSVVLGSQSALSLRDNNVSYLTLRDFYVFGYGIMAGVFIAVAIALRASDAKPRRC